MAPINTSLHALRRSCERIATDAQVEDALKNGRRRNTMGKGDNGGFIWFIEKEISGRKLRLVVEITGKDSKGMPDGKIVTLYWLKK